MTEKKIIEQHSNTEKAEKDLEGIKAAMAEELGGEFVSLDPSGTSDMNILDAPIPFPVKDAVRKNMDKIGEMHRILSDWERKN